MICKKAITKMHAIIIVVIVIVACVAATAYYMSIPTGPKVSEVKIGLLFPLTGGLAALGKVNLMAARLVIDLINERGGVLGGAKVVPIVADCKSEPDVAVSECERLCTVEKVPIIVGTFGSTLSYAATTVAEKNHVLYYEFSAVADSITARGYKYVIRACPTASMLIQKKMLFVDQYVLPILSQKLGKPKADIKIAIVYENTEWGMSEMKPEKEYCEQHGLNLVAIEGYPSGTATLAPILLKLKNLGVDVLLATSYVTDSILLMREAHENDVNFKLVIGSGGGMGVQEFVAGAGDDAAYVVSCAYLTGRMKLPNIDYYNNLWVQKYGIDPVFGECTPVHGTIHIPNMLVLFDAIERAKSVDPDAVREALLQTDIKPGERPDLLGLGYKFDEKQQNIYGIDQLAIQQWLYENGKLKFKAIWPVEIAEAEPVCPAPAWSERLIP
ncbi:MAG: ABC transporter substrate-binding protein [Candidatus Micrarchaeia archaeon]